MMRRLSGLQFALVFHRDPFLDRSSSVSLSMALLWCKVMLYADDTTVYYSDSSVNNIQEVLTEDFGQLSSWISCNGLKMNLQKMQFVFLSRRCREKEADSLQVCMNGEVLKRCDQVKYLGVIVDKQLNWKRHIEQVRKKCLSALAILYEVRRALRPKLKSLLYLTIVQPHLDYCSVVWMECCKHDAIKLERIQKSGMRMILNETWYCPSADMRSRLGWMSLSNRRRMLKAICTRQYMRGDGPAYMTNLFRAHKDLGLHSVKRENDIYLTTPRSNWMVKALATKQVLIRTLYLSPSKMQAIILLGAVLYVLNYNTL